MSPGFLSRDVYDSDWVNQQNGSFSQEAFANRSEAIDLLYAVVGEDSNFDHSLRTESIALAVWIISAIGDPTLLSRFSIFCRDIYQNSLEKLAAEQIEEEAIPLGIRVEHENNKLFRMDAIDFVKNNSHLSGNKYRLAFQNLDHGWIITDRHAVIRIMRESLVTSIMKFQSGIDRREATRCLGEMASFAKLVRDSWAATRGKRTFDLGSVNEKLFPPCIKEYLSEMKDGTNLTHLARFTLTSFLHKVGMDNDGIMELFRTAPDFNERVTQYQVDHVSGEISGTEYSPPKCAVLRSNHICYRGDDKLCQQEWLRHPLQYYQVKKKQN